MKERPILFSGSMVKAILRQEKTQTRRIVKPQPSTREGDEWSPVVGPYHPTKVDGYGEEYPGEEVFGAADEREGRVCPYGRPGEILWVRETWDWQSLENGQFSIRDYINHGGNVVYRADDGSPFDHWLPSIHMPRRASRLTLEITEVRVQRYSNLTIADTYAEGIPRTSLDPALDFQVLWDSINGNKQGCRSADDPWLWVIGFSVVSRGAGL